MNRLRKCIAEFFGTFLLIFFGVGAIIVSHETKSFGHTSVALVFGIMVMILIYSFGHVSGAHFNPAVTIGFWFGRDIEWQDALGYVVSQVFGSIIACYLLQFVFGNDIMLGVVSSKLDGKQTFCLEMILTFILMIVVLWSAVHGKAIKSFAGIAIGATIFIEALVFGPITGSTLNPVRSIGPAIVSMNLQHLWIYVTSTIIGAVLAIIVYEVAGVTLVERNIPAVE